MRAQAIAAVATMSAVIAGATAGAALAADPSSLVIRKTDFPANAKYYWDQLPASVEKGMASIGVHGKGAFFSVTIPKGTANYQSINGMVITTGSPSQAKKAYAALKTEIKGAAQKVPTYGTEQVAVYHAKPTAKAQMVVRRNSLVWQLEVAGGGLSQAAMLAELQKYAAKQKLRAGNG